VAAAVVALLLLVPGFLFFVWTQSDYPEAIRRHQAIDTIQTTVETPESVSSVTTQNPEYGYWSDCGVGSFVEMQISTEAAGNTSQMTNRTTLVEFTSGNAVVETRGSMRMAGNPAIEIPANRREIPTTIKSSRSLDSTSTSTAEGDEEIEVAGEKILCHWTESHYDGNGMKTVCKIWMSPRVPGHICRTTARSTGAMSSETRMDAVAFEKWKP
jgi:hypothetical protein